MSRWRERVYRSQRRSVVGKLNIFKKVKFAKLFLIGIVCLFLFSFLFLPLLALTLPSPDKIVRREGFSTKIVDRNGKPLYDIFEDQRRSPVEFNVLPDYLKKATISIEDKNFYNHEGFDLFGVARGMARCFIGKCQGGSTLTQQLVKNVLLTNERTLTRKVKEFLLAVQIERKYSKDQIIQMYLNEAPYGGNIVGVGTASETYFGKKVSDLNLVECAILAGIPQRPTAYSPYSSTPEAFKGRTINVLRRMKEDGYITVTQEKEALDALNNVKFLEKGATFKAPHFVAYIEKMLVEKYGETVIQTGGLKVTTTLDVDLQDKAQQIVADEIKKTESVKITNGAVVVINPETGEILSMVGSKNFNAKDYDGQVNVALSLRQPGSAIKPFTYATALKKGYTASTLIMDIPTEFSGGEGKPPYVPENYDGKYRGPQQVRYALANSLNIPAVKMLALVGVKDTMQTAYDAGISTLTPTKENMSRFGLSLTLGGGEVRLLELTSAYSIFMNEGYKVEPISILKIEDKTGKVLEKTEPKKGKQVLSPQDAFIVFDILSDNNARKEIFGTNSLLNIAGTKVAVKTGTTNDRRDNWAVGGNGYGVVGVWVGNNDNTPMLKVASGVSGASPIWRKVILELLKGKPAFELKTPEGINTIPVDTISGFRAHDGFAERNEYFKSGTEPGEDLIHLKLKVCKNDGKLATPGDIASNNFDEKEFFKYEDDGPWVSKLSDWLAKNPDDRNYPPTEYCGATNPVSVWFDSPGDKSSGNGNDINIRIKAESNTDVEKVELYIDGTYERSFALPPYELNKNLSDGVHELKAKATDKNGKTNEKTIKIGVKVAWDYTPSTPTPAPTPTPTPVSTPAISPSPSPTP